MIHCLANIMQQAGSLCHSDIKPHLSSKQACQVSHLDRMFQRILTIACSELHLAQKLHKLRMDAVYANLQCCRLAFLLDHDLDFSLSLLDHLLDPCRMDPPINDQLFKRDPRYLSPDRIKA